MLIDRFLPRFDFNEVHSIDIEAGADKIYQAIKDVRASEILLFRGLMALRALPALLLRRGRSRRSYDAPLLEEVLRSGTFILLGDEPGREIVVGSVGKFWQVSGGMLKLSGPEEFVLADHKGYAKTALNFFIYKRRNRRGMRLRTETRIVVAEPEARRKFGAYWLAIKPGSAFIRLMWLLAIKRRAEKY